jgi:hypothetical protein
MLDGFGGIQGTIFATNLRFFISAESLTALRIIPTRWALAVHVKLLMDDLFDVSLQQIQLIAIGPNTLLRAEREIASCEHCHPNDSEIPFDWLLTEVTGKRGPYEFILGELARSDRYSRPKLQNVRVASGPSTAR